MHIMNELGDNLLVADNQQEILFLQRLREILRYAEPKLIFSGTIGSRARGLVTAVREMITERIKSSPETTRDTPECFDGSGI